MAWLDLLRGAAVSLVILRHAFPLPFAGAGVVGVVMFFTLSGYLITGLLDNELRRTGRVNLPRFYLRRAARLLPALLMLVVAVVVVTMTLDPLGDRDQLPKTVFVALSWTGDLPFGHASDATFHLWTLALEEQFYLVWPTALVFAFTRRRIGLMLGSVGLLCMAATAGTTFWLRDAPDLAYSLPTSWAGCFVVGAAARLLTGLPVPGRRGVAVAASALAVLSMVPLREHAFTYLAGGPAIAILTAVLLLAAKSEHRVTGTPARALIWLGALSYSAYLWNYPLTLWLRPQLGPWAGLTAAGVTLVVAWGSHRYVEMPAQRLLTRRQEVRA